MNWKSLVVGGIIALGISIIGGLVVTFVANEFEKKNKPDLSFRQEPAISFTLNDTSTIIQRIQLKNLGHEKANNVNFSISYPEGTRILQKSFEFSIGELAEIKIKNDTTNQVKAQIPSMLPNEYMTANFLIRSSKKISNPKINLKSDTQIGRQFDWIKEGTKSQNDKSNWFLIVLLPILVIMQIGLMRYLRKRLRGLGYSSNHNNSAFVLVHQKQFAEAEKLLNFALQKSGGGPKELSLLSICKSVQGENDKANGILEGAKFYGGGNHTKALIKFAKSIICFNSGDLEDGKENLKQAIELSPEEINKYISFSQIIKDLRQNADVELIIKELEK